ncbi:uncharacterized protein N7469_001989 [Penicillium citrinum]|uniref:Uncharacterized protein n=1 Tax=Penicillium citrinum TaxID=5077 RepID=A0A9W9TTS0_PENCI|nr:uncharacterized protein N7469_001989 [Penicillium citrinum]KAJ5240398.1 hypothetical protein N7469_001989 [Penicillium citrinum]
MPSTEQRPSLFNVRRTFRSGLKRALSLSSSETSNGGRTKRPRVYALSKDGSCYETASDGSFEKESNKQNNYHWRPWEIQSEDKIDRPRTSDQVDPPEGYGLIALECVSDLDARMQILERAISHHDAGYEKILANLADMFSRLAALEAHVTDSDKKEAMALEKNRMKE